MKFDFRKRAQSMRLGSSTRDRVRRSREYYYSLFTTLAVKIVLFVFLWMLFGSAMRVMQRSFKNVSSTWKVVLPGAIAVMAAIIGYHIYKNIKEIRRLRQELEEDRKKSRGA